MLHLTPNQPSACPESGTLGTVVRQDVRHNKRPAHTDWRNTDGWDLGGFPLGLRHMSGAEGPLGTPVQHCHSSLIESLIGQGNHMTNQEKILHSYYTTAVKTLAVKHPPDSSTARQPDSARQCLIVPDSLTVLDSARKYRYMKPLTLATKPLLLY